jgi:NAD(P)-dependent dehydrogenase (short-subunit alcohol dehydrogenase family)
MVEQQIAVVTGAASGIGRAVADRLAADGFVVVGIDLTANGDPTSGCAESLACDVSDAVAVEVTFAGILDRHGRIDALVNGAGVPGVGETISVGPTAWNTALAVNLTGTFLCAQQALRHMVERGSGAIVNIASNAGVNGRPTAAPYAASKGGVIAFTKTLAVEALEHGVAVFVVLPGPTDTPMWRSLYTPEHQRSALAKGSVLPPSKVADVVSGLVRPEALAYSGAVVPVPRAAAAAGLR